MMIELAPYMHEVISLVLGGLVSAIGHKALSVAKDVSCLWPRLRAIETELAAIKAANNNKGV